MNAKTTDVLRLEKLLGETNSPEAVAYRWAKSDQGFVGDYAAWLALPADERAEYEAGAAGIGTV